ncbi:MAG: hypothetical protein KDC98_11545, partial [Planctomycetes bacterium]|nr:hypothetical protein [Planctomycetota bacterium]
NRWIDRVLLRVAPETVTRMSLSNAASGGKPVVLQRKDNAASWSCEAPPAGRGAVRQSEVESFLQRLSWISVQEYKLPLQRVANKATLGLMPAQITFELTFKDGDAEKTATFEVGSRVEGEDNVHYLLSSEAPFLMTWPAALVTSFEVDVAQSWFDPSGPPPNGDAPVKVDPVKDDSPQKGPVK